MERFITIRHLTFTEKTIASTDVKVGRQRLAATITGKGTWGGMASTATSATRRCRRMVRDNRIRRRWGTVTWRHDSSFRLLFLLLLNICCSICFPSFPSLVYREKIFRCQWRAGGIFVMSHKRIVKFFMYQYRSSRWPYVYPYVI